MEYTVATLGKMAGVSARTLRYYDGIGLLKPRRVSSSGYRVYGEREVSLLQQILFYRALGVSLEDIRGILTAPDFDEEKALKSHLSALLDRRKQLNDLIANVEKTIRATKGETTMNDKEKFEGFKQRLVEENEALYGAEIRGKYGDGEIDRSNAQLRGMSEEQYKAAEALSRELGEALKTAVLQGDPAGEAAQKACALHKRWLCCYWESYSRQAHRELAQTYVDDPRFAAYYDKLATGCARFLRDALMIYTNPQ